MGQISALKLTAEEESNVYLLEITDGIALPKSEIMPFVIFTATHSLS